ncbi:CocE/NonD family hydrolase [Pararhodonellum marinum]|uniref:CocE/NonD family hydrolase n=1 Tax=Pararhodonellum marinum TaxID=2755358 RepID=UPI00188E5998|nr:CocE/NonD family hydrolase [Pararhodonellum marinum]
MKKSSICLAIFFLLFIPRIYSQQKDLHVKNTKTILSDGVSLDNDIYLPDSINKFPIIMIRTPYGKQQFKGWGEFFSRRGLGVLIQDVRGKFGSEGEFVPFLNEKRDGLEVLDWITAQPWCDGNIGGFGASYLGFTSLTLGDSEHPAFKAIFSNSGWIKPEKMIAPGGAMHLSLAFPWLLHEETQRNRNLAEFDLNALYWSVPLKEALQNIGVSSKSLENEEKNYRLNDDFAFDKIKIPTFHIAGGFDFVKEASLEAFLKVQDVPQKLIFGPWFHNQEHTPITKVGDEDFGEESKLGDGEILQLANQWFSYWLKGEENSIMEQPEARVFVMFANQWLDFDEFPPKNTHLNFYFSSEIKANSRFGDGLLSTEVKKGGKYSSFMYDPLDPVPTTGGANFHFFPETVGIKDQRNVEEREDILVYTSVPLVEELLVVGKVIVKLFAATEGVDTDFTAKLVLVEEDGLAKNVCDGIIRARFQKGLDSEELLVPNKIYEYEIDLGHTAFAIKAGQRIRVEISSSNFPKYNRNFNVAADPYTADEMKVVQQKIFHQPENQSILILPVIK